MKKLGGSSDTSSQNGSGSGDNFDELSAGKTIILYYYASGNIGLSGNLSKGGGGEEFYPGPVSCSCRVRGPWCCCKCTSPPPPPPPPGCTGSCYWTWTDNGSGGVWMSSGNSCSTGCSCPNAPVVAGKVFGDTTMTACAPPPSGLTTHAKYSLNSMDSLNSKFVVVVTQLEYQPTVDGVKELFSSRQIIHNDKVKTFIPRRPIFL